MNFSYAISLLRDLSTSLNLSEPTILYKMQVIMPTSLSGYEAQIMFIDLIYKTPNTIVCTQKTSIEYMAPTSGHGDELAFNPKELGGLLALESQRPGLKAPAPSLACSVTLGQ